MSAPDLDRVLRENYSLIRAVCWRILGNDADAEDATQNALMSIARTIDRFDGRSSLSTWIYRIATNAALDELRRRRRRSSVTLIGDGEILARSIDTGSASALSSIEHRDELEAALADLPEEFKVAVVLRDVADLDYDEIAQILGVPIGTVRSRIARGRARLATALEVPAGNHQGVADVERKSPGAVFGGSPSDEDPTR